nr:protein kinase [Deltaproteobacteria bacterium]
MTDSSTQIRCTGCGNFTPLAEPYCAHCGRIIDESRAPLPDRAIGSWSVEAAIDAGGSAEVYRVRDRVRDRAGVAKVLLVEAAANPDLVARFRREIEISRSLRHHAIPAYLDDGLTVDDRPFLVMEDAGQTTLATRLAWGPLPVDEAIAVMRDVLAALAAAHARGIVHRDLKPGNVFMPPPGGFAKLVDFGIA